jgi:hypothetical protein
VVLVSARLPAVFMDGIPVASPDSYDDDDHFRVVDLTDRPIPDIGELDLIAIN